MGALHLSAFLVLTFLLRPAVEIKVFWVFGFEILSLLTKTN